MGGLPISTRVMKPGQRHWRALGSRSRTAGHGARYSFTVSGLGIEGLGSGHLSPSHLQPLPSGSLVLGFLMADH